MVDDLKKVSTGYAYGYVKEVINHGDYKEINAGSKSYKTKAIIVTAGAQFKKLGAPGEQELTGRGVSYCAVCDGAFFKQREIAVIGGGDSAVEEGIYLTRFADKVTIIHRRDELRAQKIIQDRARSEERISFIWDTVVESMNDVDGKVGTLSLKNVKTGETSEFSTDGVFVYRSEEHTSELQSRGHI